METTDYKVRLEIFEGPLDLLLYLIKKDELDIQSISIERITRQYLDYINTFTVPRLQRVIEGEQGGISKDVQWRGGCSFVYAELAQANATYMQRIQASADGEELAQVWSEMKERAFLSYRVDVRSIDPTAREWQALSLDDQKRLLMETLDKNMLYVPLSEMDDSTWGISESDKALNRGFFGG